MYLVELVYSERPSIFTRTLTLLRAFCVNDFVFCSFYIYSFFCHIYTIRTRDIIIITQQVYTYHVLSVLSTDRQVFANRHRTVGDERTPKDHPSLSLVCVYYHLSKMCQWPDHPNNPVSVFISDISERKLKPTEKIGIYPRSKPLSAPWFLFYLLTMLLSLTREYMLTIRRSMFL